MFSIRDTFPLFSLPKNTIHSFIQARIYSVKHCGFNKLRLWPLTSGMACKDYLDKGCKRNMQNSSEGNTCLLGSGFLQRSHRKGPVFIIVGWMGRFGLLLDRNEGTRQGWQKENFRTTWEFEQNKKLLRGLIELAIAKIKLERHVGSFY